MMVGHRTRLWPGLAALAASPGLAILAIATLLAASPGMGPAGPGSGFDSYIWRVLGFTLVQAGLSTILSLAFALPLTRALARRPVFPGRSLMVKLFGLPLVLPVIVAVFGITAVWGHNGAISNALEAMGLPGLSPLYGLSGILIAHTFFNMPLGVRLLLPVWDSIPGETWRLAGQLGMNSWQIFRLIEFPRLMAAVPGVAMLIFLLCFSSFTVVLVLGGGPRATTLEVAIWQALRLDFDIDRAVALALLQVSACLIAGILFYRLSRTPISAPTEERQVVRPDAASRFGLLADIVWLTAGFLWVMAPLVAITVSGLAGPVADVLGRANIWAAAGRSAAVGVSAGFLALIIGLMLATTARDLAVRSRRSRLADWLEIAGSQTLIVSPVVLGAGLFLLLFPRVPVFDWALPLAALVNGLVTLPYVLRLVGPVLRRTAEHHDRLCAGIGLSGISRFRIVEWPALRRPAATAMALASALATGDLTAIVLFGLDPDTTLALLLYSALGSYRMDQAAVIALLLVATCLSVFIVIEGLGRAASRIGTS